MINYFSFGVTKDTHSSLVQCNTYESALREAEGYFKGGYDISEIIRPDSTVVKAEQKHE